MKDSKIIEYFWQALGRTAPPAEGFTVVTEETWQAFSEHGFLDSVTTPAQWQQAWESLTPVETGRKLTPQDLKRFLALLNQRPVKTPFQPKGLAEGLRPVPWLNALYQKALRFETTLRPVEWQELIKTEILPRFADASEKEIEITPAFKNYLQEILAQFPSPLRKLELWVATGCRALNKRKPIQTPQAEVTTKISPSTAQDGFKKVSAQEPHIRQVEKSYYQTENKPPQDDQETLDFLESLEELEDEDIKEE